MADTFHQIYIHIIFSPKKREALIHPNWEEKLHRYITGIVQQRGHKMLAIGGMSDHLHFFIGQKPNEALSDLVREVKKASTHFVNENNLSPFHFSWQGGCGLFSHSRSQIDAVCKYILNQKEHHKKKTFREEYLKMLEDFGVNLSKKEVFEWFDAR